MSEDGTQRTGDRILIITVFRLLSSVLRTVEERSVSRRRLIEKLAGDIRRANADMSNDNAG